MEQSYLNDNDSNRSVVARDKKFVPNQSSSNGMSIGMHAAMRTQLASTLKRNS